jgi:hypothetical protein
MKATEGDAMSTKQYSLVYKMQSLWLLRDMSLERASETSGVPLSTLRYWKQHEAQIKRDYYLHLHEEAIHKLLVVQNRMADKMVEIIKAIDKEAIETAPLNQLVSALGIIIDRIVKVNDGKEIETTDSPVRFEYYDATTGKTSQTPPWAEEDFEQGGSFYSRFLRETLREDGAGEADYHGNGMAGKEDMVASPDLFDGESSLEGFEGGTDGYDWYQD